MAISADAERKLVEAQQEFIELLGALKGENIYQAAFTIATYSKIFDMILNNELECPYLSELIVANEDSIVNKLAADYVLQENTDFVNLKSFVKAKLDELHPEVTFVTE